MITIVTYIKAISDEQYIVRQRTLHGQTYRYIYVRAELIADPIFIKKVQTKFKITLHDYRSIASQVTANRAAEITRKAKKETTKKRLVSHVAETKTKVCTKHTKIKQKVRQRRREVFKGKQKIARITRELKQNPVFGSRKLLQRVSYLSNVVNNANTEEKRIEATILRDEAKAKYTEQRRGNIYSVGEANKKANRFFKFDLINDKIIYKPNAKTKITFDLITPKNRRNELNKLQSLIKAKDIPVTVTVTKDTVNFTYDNEVLSGYGYDERAKNEGVKIVKAKGLPEAEEKLQCTAVRRSYHLELQARKAKNKIEGRVMSMDANPTTLGYSISDKDGKVINCGTFDFGGLHEKTKTSSNSIESKYKVNKTHHEKHNAIKRLFEIAKHYKCSTFIMEDLDFKESNTDKGRGYNYETKVVWNRGLLEAAIKKRCENEGIKLVRVNPVYSSFIGNVMYEVYDPVAASIEIGRRGVKGSALLPVITETITDTVFSLRDNTGKTVKDVLLLEGHGLGSAEGKITWSSMYNVLGFGSSDPKFRVRRVKEVGLLQSFSVKNKKSKVIQNLYKMI